MHIIKMYFTLFLLISISYADNNKIDKAKEIAELSGLRIIIEKQKKLSTSQNIEQTKQGIENIKKTLSISDKKFWKEVEIAFDLYCKDVSNLIDIDSAINNWSEIYAEEYTETEIDSLLIFYKSDLGRKSLKKSLIIAEKWQESISNISTIKLKQASETLNAKITHIMNKYKNKIKK